MDKMTKYICTITGNESTQKSHHMAHLRTKTYKQAKKIKKLELEKLSEDELLEKYGEKKIDLILKNLETVVIKNMPKQITIKRTKNTISNKEALKDKIHDIHNYLRNNGGGYGMNALKVFNIIYGLKKIEENGLIDIAELERPFCEFSYILDMANENRDEELAEVIQKNILDSLNCSKIKDFIFYEIPKNISGNVFSFLIKEIDQISIIENATNTQLAGKIYEYFIGRDQTAISELGAYFTDRYITEFLYQEEPISVNSKLEVPIMCDPFAGSGGFTIGYILSLIKKYPDINWDEEIKKVYHFDMNEDVIKSAALEFFCLTGKIPDMKTSLKYVNSFNDEFENKKFSKIYTNPPYGGDKSQTSQQKSKRDKVKKYIIEQLKIEKNQEVILRRKKQLKNIEEEEKFEKKLQSEKKVTVSKSSERIQAFAKKFGLKGNDKESVSLIQFMDLVDTDGTVVAVLIDGVFSNGKYSDIRKCLLENFNVRKIISIPEKSFENTETKTKIIVFDNKDKTDLVEFSELFIDKFQEDVFEEINGEIFCTGYAGQGNKLKPDIKKVSKNILAKISLEQILQNPVYSLDYKDYTTINIIPNEGFEMIDMNDIFTFSPKTELSENTKIFKHFKIGDIDNKQLCLDNNKTIPKSRVKTSNICEIGDILISHVRPKQRKTVLITDNILNIENYCFEIEKLRPKKNIKYPHIILYVSLIIHCDNFESWFCKGSTYPTFKINQLKSLSLSLPKTKNLIEKYEKEFTKYYKSKNIEEFNELLKKFKEDSIQSIEIN